MVSLTFGLGILELLLKAVNRLRVLAKNGLSVVHVITFYCVSSVQVAGEKDTVHRSSCFDGHRKAWHVNVPSFSLPLLGWK